MLPPEYVLPETIVPVTGTLSCSNVLVDVVSLLDIFLNIVAILNSSFYQDLTSLTGKSTDVPVVAP